MKVIKKTIKSCNHYEDMTNNSGGWAKEDVEDRLKEIRDNKSSLTNEISKRELWNKIL